MKRVLVLTSLVLALIVVAIASQATTISAEGNPLDKENCLACHGPRGHPFLRTSHPERTNCTQCHVTRDPNTELIVPNQFALEERGSP